MDHGIHTTGSQATAELATDLPTAVTFEKCQVEHVQIPNGSLAHDVPTTLQEESAPLSVQHPFLWRRALIDRTVGRISLEDHQPVYQVPSAPFQS
jgi:hypothetical protein